MIGSADIHWRYEAITPLRERHFHDAERWLGRRERDEYAGLRDLGRRERWLLGRLVGKRLLLDHFGHLVSEPRMIQIHSRDARGRAGRPQVSFDDQWQPWSFSISHTNRSLLVAVSTTRGLSLGVDLVMSESFSTGFLNTWFAPEERAWLAKAPGHEAATIWAVKEAAYKATNRGESFVPRRTIVRRMASGGYACTYHGRDLAGRSYIHVGAVEGHVTAMVMLATEKEKIF